MPTAWAAQESDGRLLAPAAERNKGPILDVLRRVLPEHGEVVEIASGTGQHVAHFGGALRALQWQPTDPDEEMHGSILRWIEHERLTNVRPPIALDVGVKPWPIDHADGIVCINMIHVAPWQAALDLMQGAGCALRPGGALVLYGPYRRFGRHTAPSNAAFDAQLRRINPHWGVRDMEAVIDAAQSQRLGGEEIVPMPANNHVLVLRKG